ncbi:uncharacterized protein LOC116618293 [Nematostella vectensis]|uniref:uncharacterized protein LOC116618293 n=1 Tax=Nematostella vectensis TaxID=45351 RepID=UPI00139014A5|nr:uncharacterized protein LOC116618293 [Nematostella vectensis]
MHLALSFVVAVVAWVSVTDAVVEDKVTLRVFDKNLKISDEEIQRRLKEADLEGHGFKKEVVTKLMKVPGQKTPNYLKQYFYYKTVACDRVMEVERELSGLLKGAMSKKVVTKMGRAVRDKGLVKDAMCRTGVEIHLNKEQSCGQKKRQKRSPCWVCYGWCSRVDALEKE